MSEFERGMVLGFWLGFVFALLIVAGVNGGFSV